MYFFYDKFCHVSMSFFDHNKRTWWKQKAMRKIRFLHVAVSFYQSHYIINIIVDENANSIIVLKESFEKSSVTINNACSSIARRFDLTIIECVQQINIIDLLNRFVWWLFKRAWFCIIFTINDIRIFLSEHRF